MEAGIDPAAAAEGDGVLRRQFAAEIATGEGRTIDACIVPYGVQAQVSDRPGVVYREEWAAGCFDDQMRAANRVDVLMNFEHHQGISGLIGRGTELRSAADGLHGTFRIFEGSDGDKALELAREGILAGISLEAYAKRSIRGADGTVRRVKAHLDMVALCRRPAYKDARVLAVRAEVILDEELLPLGIDAEQIERARRLLQPTE